jgi:hypothetical protein
MTVIPCGGVRSVGESLIRRAGEEPAHEGNRSVPRTNRALSPLLEGVL